MIPTSFFEKLVESIERGLRRVSRQIAGIQSIKRAYWKTV